jgi:hypothetical protein
MDANATLAKTGKGVDEVARHVHGLPNRLRSLLITVDGRATAATLISRFGEAETETRLQYLLEQGFVAPAPVWDPALLREVETHFTRFVGPLARVMVRLAAKEASDLDALYAKLVEKLDPADGLRLTMTREGPLAARPPAPLSRPSGEPSAARKAPPRWNPALLAEIEAHFTRLVGPVAKVMVRRAQEQASDVEELYATLAAELEPHGVRMGELRSSRRGEPR